MLQNFGHQEFHKENVFHWNVAYKGIAQRKCISLECGLQNGTLAVFVTTQLFDDIVFMVPTAAYALIMFCTSIIFVLLVRKIN